MEILFSLFNVNFKEYQMKCFYSLLEYSKAQKIFRMSGIFLNKEETLRFFFGLIEKQISGKKSNSVV